MRCSGWSSCNDLRPGGTSADGSTLPPSPYIIDKCGATVGNTYNVSLVLWYGGKIWQCGTGGQYYVNAGIAAQWLACNDPRITPTQTAGMFYGIKGH